MAVKVRTDPTDRSMLRDTMMRTMPVAMIATEALWTDRFHRFRGVRNRPSDMMLKPIQMTASAAIRPSRRVSTSVERRSERSDRVGPRGLSFGTVEASAIVGPR